MILYSFFEILRASNEKFSGTVKQCVKIQQLKGMFDITELQKNSSYHDVFVRKETIDLSFIDKSGVLTPICSFKIPTDVEEMSEGGLPQNIMNKFSKYQDVGPKYLLVRSENLAPRVQPILIRDFKELPTFSMYLSVIGVFCYKINNDLSICPDNFNFTVYDLNTSSSVKEKASDILLERLNSVDNYKYMIKIHNFMMNETDIALSLISNTIYEKSKGDFFIKKRQNVKDKKKVIISANGCRSIKDLSFQITSIVVSINDYHFYLTKSTNKHQYTIDKKVYMEMSNIYNIYTEIFEHEYKVCFTILNGTRNTRYFEEVISDILYHPNESSFSRLFVIVLHNMGFLDELQLRVYLMTPGDIRNVDKIVEELRESINSFSSYDIYKLFTIIYFINLDKKNILSIFNINNIESKITGNIEKQIRNRSSITNSYFNSKLFYLICHINNEGFFD